MNRMKRWTGAAVLTAAVLTLAVPAMASATSGIEQGGSPLPVGSLVTIKNIGAVSFATSKFGTIECGSWSSNAEVVTNEAGKEEVVINKKGKEEVIKKDPSFTLVGSGEGSISTCGQGNVSVSDVRMNSLTSTTTGSGGMNFSFRMQVASITCSVYGSTPFTYTPGASSIEVKAAQLEVNSACGKWSLTGAFSITTSGGGAVSLY